MCKNLKKKNFLNTLAKKVPRCHKIWGKLELYSYPSSFCFVNQSLIFFSKMYFPADHISTVKKEMHNSTSELITVRSIVLVLTSTKFWKQFKQILTHWWHAWWLLINGISLFLHTHAKLFSLSQVDCNY